MKLTITVDLPDDDVRRIVREALDERESGSKAERSVLTPTEAAKRLGISRRALDRLVATGAVARYRPPFGRPGFLSDDLERVLETWRDRPRRPRLVNP